MLMQIWALATCVYVLEKLTMTIWNFEQYNYLNKSCKPVEKILINFFSIFALGRENIGSGYKQNFSIGN